MKKFIFFLVVLMASCASNDEIKVALKNHVVNNASTDPKYKLESYKILDTITNQKYLDSLSVLIENKGLLYKEPTFDTVKAIRSIKFNELTLRLIYVGDEIRKQQCMLDSLIENWDSVTPYSYELNYALHFLKLMKGTEDGDWWEEHEDRDIWAGNNIGIYRIADSIYNENPDEVYCYHILHKYSGYNQLFGKHVSITEMVTLDKDLQCIDSEIMNGLDDLFQQVMK